MQIVFQYQGIKKVRLGQHHWDRDDQEEWGSAYSSLANNDHWDSSVYSRVFLDSSSAQVWEAWNRWGCMTLCNVARDLPNMLVLWLQLT